MPKRCGFKGALSHRREGGAHLLPSHLSPPFSVTTNVPQLLIGARPAKPQADNECHTVMTTCTFMERGRRTSLARTLAAYDETSTINQTIKERAARHPRNPGTGSLGLIYDRYQKRAVSKQMCLELICGKEKYHFPNVATTSVNDVLQLHSSTLLPAFPIWTTHMLSMNNSPPTRHLEAWGFPIGSVFAILGFSLLLTLISFSILYITDISLYTLFAFKANVTRKREALIFFQ